MFPTISDLINYLFGINIPLPIQTFGFFVAVAFLGAAYLLGKELKRKEKDGLLFPIEKKYLVGKRATLQELFSNGIVGFILGFKLVPAFTDYTSFANDPQGFILSLEGNWFGGIVFAVVLVYLKYREKEKTKLDIPKWETAKVHPYQMVSDMTIVAAVSGLLGAKIFHNLENINDFMADPVGSLLSFSGLTFYGGLICGAIAVIYYERKNQVNHWHLVDAAAPALFFAYGFGRIGCQLSGDGDWGIVNTLTKPEALNFLPGWMWAFDYPHNVINEGVPIPDCAGNHCFQLEQAVFPTPFYETIISFLFLALLWSIRKKITVPGVLFSIYLVLNGIERFCIEQIRINTMYSIFGKEITQAEIISVCLILLGSGMVIYLYRKNRKGVS